MPTWEQRDFEPWEALNDLYYDEYFDVYGHATPGVEADTWPQNQPN